MPFEVFGRQQSAALFRRHFADERTALKTLIEQEARSLSDITPLRKDGCHTRPGYILLGHFRCFLGAFDLPMNERCLDTDYFAFYARFRHFMRPGSLVPARYGFINYLAKSSITPGDMKIFRHKDYFERAFSRRVSRTTMHFTRQAMSAVAAER